MEFEATIKIDHQKIADQMCAAIEGGMSTAWVVNFFAVPEVTSDEDGWPWYSTTEFWASNFTVRVDYCEDEWDTKLTSVFISPKDLQEGINIMANKYPYQFSLMVNNEGDSITGDVFLQCVVLKDVIYG